MVDTQVSRKCKYCHLPAKINYHGIKRKHKGYFRTCGNEECLKRQYSDVRISAKKAYRNKNISISCLHCKEVFVKEHPNQKWCSKCVPNKSSSMIMQRYGISSPEYELMVINTDGKCQICLLRKATVIDHNHVTGKVRGLLCSHCNTSLHLVENEEALERALAYIRS